MYTTNLWVPYSKCDSTRTMTLSEIMNELQDCCTFQAEEIDIGLDYLQSNNLMWIVVNYHIVIDRYPVFGQHIQIHTWPYEFKGFFGFRNFTITDEDDNIMVRAESTWVLVNIDTQTPARLTDKILNSYVKDPRLDMEYIPRKLTVMDDLKVAEPMQVPDFFIDINGHMNNEKYVILSQEYIPEGMYPSELRIEYKKSAMKGDMLYPHSGCDANKYQIVLCDADGLAYSVAEFFK